MRDVFVQPEGGPVKGVFRIISAFALALSAMNEYIRRIQVFLFSVLFLERQM